MAIFSNGPNATWTLSLKVLLASILVLSAAILLRLSAPPITAFVTSELPSIYALFLTWLRPPYLYILVNCIIISIVASSKLQLNKADARVPEYAAPPLEPVVRAPAEDLKLTEIVSAGYGIRGDVYDPRSVKVVYEAYGPALEAEAKKADDEAVVAVSGGDEIVLPETAGSLQRYDSSDLSFLSTPNEDRREKPPVSARFGHRKSAKSSPEGNSLSLSLSLSLSPLFDESFKTPSVELILLCFGAAGRHLRVSRPKVNDTLESTWRTITDGRAMPLRRHLKKSDTWDSHARRNDENSSPTPPQMKKSETFATRPGPTNRPASPSPGSGKLRREPSLGQDDLARRVDEFIRKFNEQMRLQRQESLNQFQEMINRGAG